MEGKYTEKGNVNEGYDGPSSSSCGRPTSDSAEVDVDRHVEKNGSDFEYGNGLEKDKSRVCFVCRIVCVLASIAISVFLIVWFSAIESGLTRNPPLGMSPTTKP